MRCKIFLLFLAIFLSLSIVSASITFGNLSHSIDLSYTPLSTLSGWLNFSLSNEPGSTLISAFNQEITLKELVELNGISCDSANPYECTCFPSDCEYSFSSVNSPNKQKSYELKSIETKLFGIKINQNVSAVTDFKFNVTTDAQSSCLNPLMIDLFDDGNIELKTSNVSDDECFIEKPFGCFDLADVEQTTQVGSIPLCQRISLPPVRGFIIGANVLGNQSASFSLTISAAGNEKTCAKEIGANGEVSCKVILDNDLQEETVGEVCIFANEGSAGKFSINFEDNQTCGFTADSSNTPHDFEIFAKPLKYSAQSKLSFNNNLFEEEVDLGVNIFDYIDRRYQSKCEEGCIIPLRIYSGSKQTVTLKDLIIDYDVNGLNTAGSEQRNFTDIASSPPLFSSLFTKYDLDPANIITPLTPSNSTNLEIKIGNQTITESLNIIDIPNIKTIIPKTSATLVPTRFFAIIESPGNLTYSWDFGDGSVPITTKSNYVEHTYNSLGAYTLNVNITNEFGSTSKSTTINIVAPYNAINTTLSDYKARLKSIDNELFVLESWVQDRILEIVDTNDLKSAINRIEGKYKELFETEDEELVKLMSQLNELNVPLNFGTSLEIKPSSFTQSKSSLNLAKLEEFGAGNLEEDQIDKYYGAINRWAEENVEINFESKSYAFFYPDLSQETVLSHMIMKLNSNSDIDYLYIVIEGDTNQIKFLEDYSEREIDETHFGIDESFSSGEERKIEILYPGQIDAINYPIYFSPEFKELELGFTPGVCNSNNICEAGENYKNCRVDCKPVGLTITFIAILLVLAFIIYVALQEWYKRNYQKKLFKNPNDLYNLINFLDNSEKQGLSKDKIFSSLKQRKWEKEQINFAWKKFKGKRTGMFEIPILKPFEKRKIRKELEKRKKMGLK